MITIGVTGSLASGKSEAAAIFKKHGAVLFDADKAARSLIAKGRPAHRAILKLFGKGFAGKNGQIDRAKLAAHVFSHPKDLKKLNILIHPGVIFASLKLIEKNKHKKGFVVLDVPLLFESKMERLADVTVVVAAKKSTIFSRAKKKGLSSELIKKILAAQWPMDKKKRLADFVVENDGTAAALEKQVVKILKTLKQGGSA